MRKTIEYYMSLPYRIELVPDSVEGGFAVSIPDLPGCLSVGETVEEAYSNIEDAKKAWLEAALDDGTDIPEPRTVDKYSGQFKLRIPKSLHKILVENSKREGMSLNQYCLCLLSRNDALISAK